MAWIEAHVFDPATYAAEPREDLLPRLQIHDKLENFTEPTEVQEIHDDWTIYRYGRYLKIERFNPDQTWELWEFNADRIYTVAIVPVTLAVHTRKSGVFLEEYHMHINQANEVLKRNVNPNVPEGYWEWVPDRTKLINNKVEHYLEHSSHYCVRCIRENTLSRGRLTQLVPGRLGYLCRVHHNESNKQRRIAEREGAQ